MRQCMNKFYVSDRRLVRIRARFLSCCLRDRIDGFANDVTMLSSETGEVLRLQSICCESIRRVCPDQRIITGINYTLWNVIAYYLVLLSLTATFTQFYSINRYWCDV